MRWLLLALLVGCSAPYACTDWGTVEPVTAPSFGPYTACLDNPECINNVTSTITDTTFCPDAGPEFCTMTFSGIEGEAEIPMFTVGGGLTLGTSIYEGGTHIEIDCDTIHEAVREKCGE